MTQNENGTVQHEAGFPWKHIVGFALSIILTLLALWTAFGMGLSKNVIIVVIIVFAFLQAAVQLFMFMHVTETENGRIQTWNMIHGFIAFIVIVAGSIWVMSFGMGYMH